MELGLCKYALNNEKLKSTTQWSGFALLQNERLKDFQGHQVKLLREITKCSDFQDVLFDAVI